MATKCKCPEGPTSVDRGFGERADEIAALNHIPPPRFGVTIHTAPCPLPDVPHRPVDDYAWPEAGSWDWDNAVHRKGIDA